MTYFLTPLLMRTETRMLIRVMRETWLEIMIVRWFISISDYKGPPQLIKSVRFGYLMKLGGVGFETLKKTNFIITIRYEIPTFSLVGPFFKEGGGGPENFGWKLKF